MYITIKNDLSYRLMTGGNVVMVASVSAQGQHNIMTCAWNTPFAQDEMMLVLDMDHCTTKNIKDTKKLTICVPSYHQVKDVLKVGSVHGLAGVNKFAKFNLKARTCSNGLIAIDGCLAYLECNLSDDKLLNDKGICLCKVEHACVLRSAWDEQAQHFGKGMCQTMHHVTDSTFISNGSIMEGND